MLTVVVLHEKCMLLIGVGRGWWIRLEENLSMDGSSKIVVHIISVSVFIKNISIIHFYNKLNGFIIDMVSIYSVYPLSELPVMYYTPLLSWYWYLKQQWSCYKYFFNLFLCISSQTIMNMIYKYLQEWYTIWYGGVQFTPQRKINVISHVIFYKFWLTIFENCIHVYIIYSTCTVLHSPTWTNNNFSF